MMLLWQPIWLPRRKPHSRAQDNPCRKHRRYKRAQQGGFGRTLTGNLRAVQILLGHTKLESTVRYLGVDAEDALTLSEATEV